MFKNEKSWLNYAVCLGFDSLQSVTKKLATSKKKNCKIPCRQNINELMHSL